MPVKNPVTIVPTSTTVDLPDLSNDLYVALRDDIASRGILVPIIVDAATGEVLDGKIRRRIAEELGLRDVPTIFLGKMSLSDRQEVRHGLNCYRRHLTRAQLQAAVD